MNYNLVPVQHTKDKNYSVILHEFDNTDIGINFAFLFIFVFIKKEKK